MPLCRNTCNTSVSLTLLNLLWICFLQRAIEHLRALILFIQTLALYNSFTYLLTYFIPKFITPLYFNYCKNIIFSLHLNFAILQRRNFAAF